jgi:hypothetical protein
VILLGRGVPRDSGWKIVMLVDFPDLLTAAKLTAHLVFDPRCLCGDKPFACLDRTNGLIHFQLRNVAYRVVEALRKSCINSTRINPEHTAPPEFRSLDGHPSGRLLSAHAGVVALKQVGQIFIACRFHSPESGDHPDMPDVREGSPRWREEGMPEAGGN